MAAPEKKALYMGYSNIPFAVGWSVGNFVGGPAYDHFSDKFELAKRHMVNVLGAPAEGIDELQKTEIMPRLAEMLNTDVKGAQRLLWETYHPQGFWWGLVALGMLCGCAMIAYHLWLEADAKRQSVTR
jgi:hypothetical protein